LNNNDLKSIINTACKYEDTEVLQKIASSKLIKTAGVRDLLEGLGLQLSQTANESQFKNQRELTTFLSFSGSVDDLEASKEIFKWWSEQIKSLGNDSISLDVYSPNAKNGYVKEITFSPKNCVQRDSLKVIYDSLPADDLNKKYGIDPGTITGVGVMDNKDNPPTLFDRTLVDTSNNQRIYAGTGNSTSSPNPVPLGVVYLKISNNGGNPGYLDYLIKHLNTTNPPKLSENIHVKIFNMLNANMNNKAMSSMVRKNGLAETPRAGLITNWNYIVNLPKEIESRMSKTPKNPMEYKQKLALKKYGRSLSQLLNTRIKFQHYAAPATFTSPSGPSIPTSSFTNEGLNTEIPFYKINELSNSYFMDSSVQAQVMPLMERLGSLLNNIIPELDKDTSLTRNLINKIVKPTDYLDSRGKEFN